MSRVFTLEEAQAALPEIHTMTRHAFELSLSFAEELHEAEHASEEERAKQLRQRIQVLVASWKAAVQDLDAQVKGLWLVDFDAGDGCWSWAYPEEHLAHWHSYEGGFGSRVPLAMRPAAKERAQARP